MSGILKQAHITEEYVRTATDSMHAFGVHRCAHAEKVN